MERELKDINGGVGNTSEKRLVMYNSNEHTFGDAIYSIWLATGYEEIQCEQLTLLIDMKGSVVIKIGNREELMPMLEILLSDGFDAEII